MVSWLFEGAVRHSEENTRPEGHVVVSSSSILLPAGRHCFLVVFLLEPAFEDLITTSYAERKFKERPKPSWLFWWSQKESLGNIEQYGSAIV